jgi:hypothetical protein
MSGATELLTYERIVWVIRVFLKVLTTRLEIYIQVRRKAQENIRYRNSAVEHELSHVVAPQLGLTEKASHMHRCNPSTTVSVG